MSLIKASYLVTPDDDVAARRPPGAKARLRVATRVGSDD